MPAATGPKRVKNKRIERPFIIGSEAWPLDSTNRKPDTPVDHTKGWRVYVRVPDGQPDITRWLKKVQFRIFHTYMNPNRTVENPPFEIHETGWGGFTIDIRLHFVSEAGLKSESRQHFLQLEPYGDEELQAQQKADKLVRSEFLEYVEFNEPSEALFDTLTDDSQFGSAASSKKGGAAAAAAAAAAASGAKGRGGAKGASKAHGKDENSSNSRATVELPEVGTTKDPFSKEMEQRLLDMLAKAEQEVEKLLEEEKIKEKQVAEELAALRAPPPPPETKAEKEGKSEKPASTATSITDANAKEDVKKKDDDADADAGVDADGNGDDDHESNEDTEMANDDEGNTSTTVNDAKAEAEEEEADEDEDEEETAVADKGDDADADAENEEDEDEDDDGDHEEEDEEAEEDDEEDGEDGEEEEEDNDDDEEGEGGEVEEADDDEEEEGEDTVMANAS